MSTTPPGFVWENSVHLRPRQLSVNLTTSCSVGCRHCAPDCLPEISDDSILVQSLAKFLVNSDFHSQPESLFVSGGEPFDRFRELIHLNDVVKQRGIDLIVQTSAHWASSPSKTVSLLSRLNALAEICISLDQYHQEKVSFGNIVSVINHCINQQIPVNLVIRLWNPACDPFWESLFEEIPTELLEYCRFDIEAIRLGGRATQKLKLEEEIKRGVAISGKYMLEEQEKDWIHNSVPCHMCQRPVIDSDGVVSVCCNVSLSKSIAGLNVGKIEDLDWLSLQEKVFADLDLQTIRHKGPLELLQQQDKYTQEAALVLLQSRSEAEMDANINCKLCALTLLMMGKTCSCDMAAI